MKDTKDQVKDNVEGSGPVPPDPNDPIQSMLSILTDDSLTTSALDEALARDFNTLAIKKKIPVQILYNLRNQVGYNNFTMLLKLDMLDQAIKDELEVVTARMKFKLQKGRAEAVANEVTPKRRYRGF